MLLEMQERLAEEHEMVFERPIRVGTEFNHGDNVVKVDDMFIDQIGLVIVEFDKPIAELGKQMTLGMVFELGKTGQLSIL